MSNYLDRLTSDRAANRSTGSQQASVPRAANTAPGGMREAGRQAAANDLTWQQVAALCALLPLARDAALHWAGDWGTDRVRAIAGATIADSLAFTTFGEWAAWMEGVNDVAAAIEVGA